MLYLSGKWVTFGLIMGLYLDCGGTFGNLDDELVWFAARVGAMTSGDVPHDSLGGLLDTEYSYFDEEHNAVCTLQRREGIFRIETEVPLPEVGGAALWTRQTERLREGCRDIPRMQTEAEVSANGQIGRLEVSMPAAEASVDAVARLRSLLVADIWRNLELYDLRYVRAEYRAAGICFHARIKRFDVVQALLVKGPAAEVYDGGEKCSEEMKLCIEMNRIDMLDPDTLITEDEFVRSIARCGVGHV